MNWFLVAFRKYAEFSGRAQRAEYWYFVLFYVIFYIVLGIVEVMLGLRGAMGHVGFLTGLYGLVMFLPSLAVTVRRLHDTNRSGWWVLLYLIPLVGFIVLLVFTVQDSTAGDNEYGPNPKRPAA